MNLSRFVALRENTSMDNWIEEFDNIIVAAQAVLNNPKLLYYTDTIDFERFQELSEALQERQDGLKVEAAELRRILNDKISKCETLCLERDQFQKVLKDLPNYLGRGNKHRRISSQPKIESVIGYIQLIIFTN